MTGVGAGAQDAPVCLDDLRCAAAAVLPPEVWDFVEGGSGTETSLAANPAAFSRIALVPRILTGVSTADTSGTLLGVRATMPVAVAPMAYQQLVHPEGEVATARAAARAGVPFTLSTLASRRFADIAATGATTWFQLYWLRERSQVARLVATAEEIGCRALMLTADVPILGRRLRDLRNQFALPPQVSAVNLAGSPPAGPAVAGGSPLAAATRQILGPGLTWRDLAWLRQRTRLPLLVKGILDPRDARRAVEQGADAVVVSNHGGRQCDAAPPSVSQLPEVVAAVAGDAAVLLDSGVRSGTDVLRALALGAHGVLLGRPVLWGLAAAGERGVAGALTLVQQELAEAMTLAGCAGLADAAALDTVRLPVP